MWDPDRFARALDFAADAHGAQRVPGSERPYLAHVVKVAQEALVAALHDPSLDADVIAAAALLHDTVEDTEVTLAAVEAEFGPTVAACVAALTKDASLPKPEQMPDSLRRLLVAPVEGRVVKLADRICNLEPPPHYWTRARGLAYQQEAREILTALGSASSALAGRLARRIEAYPERLPPE